MEERIQTRILSFGQKQALGMRAVRLLSIALAPILSGALLVFPFPRYDVSWLVWVGLVPLLMAISGRSTRAGFYSSYVCAVVFFTGVFSWAFAIPGYKLAHQGILAFYAAFYFAFFGLIFSYVAKRSGVTSAHLAAPFIWVGLEYVRSNFAFLALPWPLLAHSQYQHPQIIQFATVTGAYGVSFLIVLVNSALAVMLLPLVYRPGQNDLTHHQIISNRGRNALAGLAVLLVAFALIYGNAVLSEPLTGKKIKLSVLQGNIDQEKKSNPRRHSKFIMQKYEDLTSKVSQHQPDLIVWPEAATPGFVLKNMYLQNRLVLLIREIKTHFIVGSSEYSKFAKNPADRKKSGNTALFFSSKGKVLGQYLKIRLLPFAEYLPYEGIIPWPDFIVPMERRYWDAPGKEFTLFDLDEARFGTIICWENAFPNLFRHFVKNGANFMLNITNEGWFGETAAPYQFLAMCVFRSVENRISIARAANTGISCFIDPYGRVTDRVWSNNKDIYVSGYLTREIHLSEARTFYTNYGDIFVYITLAITVLFIALSLLKGKKEPGGF